MTNQIYFLGYRPEHFTGWNGSGVSVYSSAVSTNSSNYTGVGYIGMNSSTSILWKDLNLSSLEPLYFLVSLGYTYGTNITTGINSFVITDGTNAIIVNCEFAYNSSGTQMGGYISVEEGTYDDSTEEVTISDTILPVTKIFNSPTGSFFENIYISLSSSNTTGYDTLTVSSTSIGTSYTGDLTKLLSSYTLGTALSKVSSIFDYNSTYNSSRQSAVSYIVVSNFDMSSGYLDYTNVSSSGYYDDWSGTVSTLNTYPMVPGTTSNGLYSYNIGDKATFTSSKQLNTNSTMEPKFIFVESSLSSTIDNSKAQGIISNSGTNLVYSLGSADALTTTNTSYQWFSNQNPATLSSWTVDTINSYNFGIQRTA